MQNKYTSAGKWTVMIVSGSKTKNNNLPLQQNMISVTEISCTEYISYNGNCLNGLADDTHSGFDWRVYPVDN